MEAIAADTIQVAGVTYRLPPDMLVGLIVGQCVTVAWGEREGQLWATTVTREGQQ